MFTFTCPFCRQEIEAEEVWIGQVAECPYCGKQVEIKRSPKPRDNQPRIANAAHSATTPLIDYKRNMQYFRLASSFVKIAAVVTGGIGLIMLTMWICEKEISAVPIGIISLGISFFLV